MTKMTYGAGGTATRSCRCSAAPVCGCPLPETSGESSGSVILTNWLVSTFRRTSSCVSFVCINGNEPDRYPPRNTVPVSLPLYVPDHRRRGIGLKFSSTVLVVNEGLSTTFFARAAPNRSVPESPHITLTTLLTKRRKWRDPFIRHSHSLSSHSRHYLQEICICSCNTALVPQ